MTIQTRLEIVCISSAILSVCVLAARIMWMCLPSAAAPRMRSYTSHIFFTVDNTVLTMETQCPEIDAVPVCAFVIGVPSSFNVHFRRGE